MVGEERHFAAAGVVEVREAQKIWLLLPVLLGLVGTACAEGLGGVEVAFGAQEEVAVAFGVQEEVAAVCGVQGEVVAVFVVWEEVVVVLGVKEVAAAFVVQVVVDSSEVREEVKEVCVAHHL